MVMVLLFGLGIMGYSRMGADLMPSISSPAITVSCDYAGAGPEDIKRDIVQPIENAISGISGIDTITANARLGNGSVTIRFTMETDMKAALMDVSKAVDRVSGRLPADADKPSIFKFDTSDAPVLTLGLNGTVPYEQLYNTADTIKQQLEKIQDVANVGLQGAQMKDLHIKLDKAAMEYYGVNVNTLLNKIRAENSSAPLGQLQQDIGNQSVRLVGEFKNINEVRNLLIPIPGGASIRLGDLAEVGLSYPDQNQLLRMDGQNAIGIRLSKQSDANVVEVVGRVKKELDAISKNLPQGIKLVILDDTTTFIDSSLKEIKRNLIEGIITTALVLLLFLRDWRSSLIVLVAIPTSLVSTFFVMYLNKFTLNMMSLMGMSLCVGILVDDSIVILENIQRHLKMGKKPVAAAIEGRKEIGMAAIAITLCDVVVFAPVAFMSGMTGQFFREFGLTVAFASLFSLFVSFTVTPMLASKVLKREGGHHEDDAGEKGSSKLSLINDKLKIVTHKLSFVANLFDRVNAFYRKTLIWSMDNRWKVLVVFTAMVVASVLLIPMKVIKFESQPQTDNSRFSINVTMNPGSSLAQTDAKVKQIEDYLQNGELKKYIRAFNSSVGGDSDMSTAQITVRLFPKNQRDKTPTELSDMARAWARKNVLGANVTASSGGFGGGGNNISVVVSGLDANVLKEISLKVEEIMKSINGIADITNPMRSTQSEIRVSVDRLAAAEYGVSNSDLTSVIRTGIQGATTGVYREGGLDYDIIVSFKDKQVNTIYDIGALKVASSSGKQVTVSQVAKVYQTDAQRRITRQDRQDMVNITAILQRNAILGTVSDDVKKQLNALPIPFGYNIKYGGAQKQMDDQFSALGAALIVAVALVFMILVVLYESYLTPFIRMLSLPCGVIGAMLALALTRNTLNLTTVIGLIMLDGLASKNGTLLIDYTNTLMKRGHSLRDALIESGTTRIRPIIMTTLTMITGMLPSALSLGDGSEMKTGMAIVVIGGMITSTMFTPIIVPVVYTIMDDIKKFFTGKRLENSYVKEVSQYEA